jgi:hypothetical protein
MRSLLFMDCLTLASSFTRVLTLSLKLLMFPSANFMMVLGGRSVNVEMLKDARPQIIDLIRCVICGLLRRESNDHSEVMNLYPLV